MESQIFESAIFFALYLEFRSLIRTLASPKVLPFGNKNKSRFILYFAHLFVPLPP